MEILKSETCIVCSGKTDNEYLFCENCTPLYGQTVRAFDGKTGKYLSLYIGRIPFWGVIISCLRGHLPIKWWMGTDALTMWYRPPGKSRLGVLLHRFKMRLLEPFIYQHWVTGPRLIHDLEKSKSIKADKIVVAYWPGKYHVGVKKIPHEGFNVLYYDPGGGVFERWKYGIDIIEEIKKILPDINWIRIDGSQDMRSIYPKVDLYIRPSRHDGEPRINIECELNQIPVLYSEDGSPEVNYFVAKIKAFKNQKP